MRYRTLGATGPRVSMLGYGGWALGIKGWPGVDEREAARTVEAAVDRGVTFFDTAPVYGFGRSEELLGRILAGSRKDIFIATKCGLRWDDRGRVRHDLTPASIRREIDRSLKRLGTDYIDLYQVHWPDRHTPLQDTLSELRSLQEQGAIRHIGVSNFTAGLVAEALRHAPLASVQQVYNMLQRDAERDILPLCSHFGLGFICYSPLAQGLLAGAFSRGYRPGRHDVRRLNPLYRSPEVFEVGLAMAGKAGARPAAAALSFVARRQAVSTVLVSMTRRSHLIENCTCIDQDL